MALENSYPKGFRREKIKSSKKIFAFLRPCESLLKKKKITVASFHVTWILTEKKNWTLATSGVPVHFWAPQYKADRDTLD